MKKLTALLAGLALMAGVATQASATLLLEESYLGTKTDVNTTVPLQPNNEWLLGPGYTAAFNFDLTQVGGGATLKDASNTTVKSVAVPSQDETRYDPNTMVL